MAPRCKCPHAPSQHCTPPAHHALVPIRAQRCQVGAAQQLGRTARRGGQRRTPQRTKQRRLQQCAAALQPCNQLLDLLACECGGGYAGHRRGSHQAQTLKPGRHSLPAPASASIRTFIPAPQLAVLPLLNKHAEGSCAAPQAPVAPAAHVAPQWAAQTQAPRFQPCAPSV